MAEVVQSKYDFKLPANKEDISRYFIDLYNQQAPYSRIETVFYAVKWKHDCSSEVNHNPCDSKFLHSVIQGLKKLLSKPIVKKEPITPGMLRDIVNKYGQSSNLMDIRLCSMLLLSFAGFLRHSELVNIRRCDLDLCVSHVNIFIVKSKTDIYRQGAWVLIGATNTVTCPVNMLKRYLELAGLHDNSDEGFLYRPLTYFKSSNSHQLKPEGKMSYTRCLELFKQALVSVGLDPKKFGLHSLRSGGASAAANVGVPDRLFKNMDVGGRKLLRMVT
jgi:integrase